MYLHLKALQQKHRESLKYQEQLKREAEYTEGLSDEFGDEGEERHEGHDQEDDAYFQVASATKSNSNADKRFDFEGNRNRNGGEKQLLHKENGEEAQEEQDFLKMKHFGRGSDQHRTVRENSPTDLEANNMTNAPIPIPKDSKNNPKEQISLSAASTTRKAKVIYQTSGNFNKKKTQESHSTTSLTDPSRKSNTRISSVSSLTNVPDAKINPIPVHKKPISVTSRPRLKPDIEEVTPGYRQTKSTTSSVNVFEQDLQPLANPVQGLSKALNDLNSADWEENVRGFRTLVALLRHHPECIKSELRTVNMAGIKQLSNLRSQVTRAACLFFKEMFCHLGKLMEMDVEKIGEKLLDKTADTNKFIRESSYAALDEMFENLSPTKTIIPLENFGAKHKNSVVKTTTAKMFNVVIRKLGPEKCLTQMGDRILPMLVKFLQEGSLETRTYAKAGMTMLMSHAYFDTALRNHVSADSLRNVVKTIDGIKKELVRKSKNSQTVRW